MITKKLNTIVLTLLLTSASALADVSKPYGVFNPLAIFESLPKPAMQKADSAFYNYGNRSYDFVVSAMPIQSVKLPKQIASLEQR